MKLSSWSIAFGSLLVIWSQPRYAAAEGWRDHTWVGGRFGIGFQTLATDLVTNTPKSGYALNFLGVGEYRTNDFGTFGLGLGLNRTSVTGQTTVRLQELAIHSLMVDLYYLYPIFPSFFSAGVMFSSLTSPGARMDFRDLNTMESLFKVGPKARLTFRGSGTEWFAEADFLYSLNSTSKSIWGLTAAAGVLFRLGDEPQSEPEATPHPTPAPEPIPAPMNSPAPTPTPAPISEEAPKVAVQLDAKLVTFDVDKTTIKPKSLDFLSKISALLMAQGDNWKTIQISGHTDGTGKPAHNLKLSKGRAEAVVREFIRNGIGSDQLTSEGYGSTRMIPDEPKNSAVHRRVELSFGGVIDPQKLQRALDSLKSEQTENSGANL